jgi:hypothetical protein
MPDSPRQRIQRPDRSSSNKHNTINPFLIPLLCSLLCDEPLVPRGCAMVSQKKPLACLLRNNHETGGASTVTIPHGAGKRGSLPFMSESLQNCHRLPLPCRGLALPPIPPPSGITLRQRSRGGTLLFCVFPLKTIPRFFCYSGGCGIVGTRSVVQAPVIGLKGCPSGAANPQPGVS